MDGITLKVAAKINLTLDIVGVSGGYHLLKSIMTSIGIYDILTVRPSKDIRVTMKGVVNDEKNVAYRAVTQAVRRFGIDGADVVIKKGIPFSGGLGGSSADISGVLIGLKEIYGLKDGDIYPLLSELGSDTVFMAEGGAAICSGRGNDIEHLPPFDAAVTVIKPTGGANTAAVFAEYDKSPQKTAYTDNFIGNIGGNPWPYIGNALTGAASCVNPEIKAALNDMGGFTEYVAMTGSGSAVYGIFRDEESALRARNKLKDKYSTVITAATVPKGIVRID